MDDWHDNSVTAAIIIISNLDFISVTDRCIYFVIINYETMIMANYFVVALDLVNFDNISSLTSLSHEAIMHAKARII